MKVTDKNIALFLQKYMDGLTSVDEERMLADYFRKHGDKPAPEGIDGEDWQVYREMFAMFEPKLQARHNYVRHLIAASATILLAFGAYLWLNNSNNPMQPIPDQSFTAIAEQDDSTNVEIPEDTLNIEIAPASPPAAKPNTRKKININRYRDTPPPPRYYMAQASAPADSADAIDLEEVARQADLLMKAVYVQQQIDLYDIMSQYAAIANIDYMSEEEEVYY